MKILSMEQGSEKWHMERVGKVSGSRIVDILATISKGEAAARRGASQGGRQPTARPRRCQEKPLPDRGHPSTQKQRRSARRGERGVRYLATRFSAKEAFSKAIGLGMTLPMTWRRCEIASLPTGQPVIVLHGELKSWFEAQGLSAHLSVTDETDYAASFCVVEK